MLRKRYDEERTLEKMIAAMTGIFLAFSLTAAQQDKHATQEKSSCPMHEQHKTPAEAHHHDGVVERADQVMGFSHDKASHHFRLLSDGGAIKADPLDPNDEASRDAIRSHFTHIAKMFAEGD